MIKAALSLVAMLLFLPEAFAGETVTVAVGEWPPYTSQHDVHAKIAQTLATEAFALEGVHTVYRYCPWKRCYVEVEEGRVDATLPWFRSAKREKAFLFSQEPLIHDKEVFFHLKSLDFHWTNFEDLKKYRVAGTLGYYDTDLLESEGVPLDKVTNEELNFEKMLVGRVDLYATSLDVGYYIIHKLYDPTKAVLFTNDPKPLHEADTFVMFSRKIPNGASLRDTFDKGLRALKASGRYDEILSADRDTAE